MNTDTEFLLAVVEKISYKPGWTFTATVDNDKFILRINPGLHRDEVVKSFGVTGLDGRTLLHAVYEIVVQLETDFLAEERWK